MTRFKILFSALLLLAFTPAIQAVPLMTETITNNYHFTWDDHTYMYASTVDFYQQRPDVWNGGVWVGTDPTMESSLSWSHTLPPGLRVPPDMVSRAKLKIDGEYVDVRGNLIEIQGTWDWDPLEHQFQDNSIYDLAKIDESGFWNGGSIGVSIFAAETSFRIDEAVLMMDYAYAVPEPTGFVLLGLGLFGGLVYRKVRRA